MSGKIIEINGRNLALTNLEKELYPLCAFTKAHVLEYYRHMATVLLPHLHGRALTMKRYPAGVDKPFFFEKRCPVHRPPWAQTAGIPQEGGETLTACLVNDLETLLWVANLAALELHVPLARAATPQTPDAMVFDLDPGEPANILACAQVALILRDLLSRLGLSSRVKSSGQKGLHLFVPLNDALASFADTRQFSRTVAIILEKNYPELVTAKMAKSVRTGKVFINWEQNDATKTMICVYSLRAREKPFVSCPLGWQELEELAKRGAAEKFHVQSAEALRRVEEGGDLFREVLEKRQKLPHL